MEIEVKKNSIYKEVIIKDGNVSFETGLLDEKEVIELAKQLACIIAELLE